MSKLRNRKSQITTRHSPPAFLIDDTAQRYLSALEHAEVLKKALLEMCRKAGFTPKDAPKTKILAGELYEVLASRATRTVVDQNRARALREKLRDKLMHRELVSLLRTRVVFDLADGADRAVEKMPAWVKYRFAELAQHRPAGTRLTVRKKKEVRSRKSDVRPRTSNLRNSRKAA